MDEIIPKHKNAFLYMVPKALRLMGGDLKVDTKVKKTLALNLYKLTKNISRRVSEVVGDTTPLNYRDIRSILPQFLHGSVLALAIGRGVACVMINRRNAFIPKQPEVEVTATAIELSPTEFKHGVKKLKSKLTNESMPKRIDSGSKRICEILASITTYLASEASRNRNKQKIEAIDYTDVHNTIRNILPEGLCEGAASHGNQRVNDYLNGVLEYKRAPPKPKQKIPKVKYGKRKRNTARKVRSRKRSRKLSSKNAQLETSGSTTAQDVPNEETTVEFKDGMPQNSQLHAEINPEDSAKMNSCLSNTCQAITTECTISQGDKGEVSGETVLSTVQRFPPPKMAGQAISSSHQAFLLAQNDVVPKAAQMNGDCSEETSPEARVSSTKVLRDEEHAKGSSAGKGPAVSQTEEMDIESTEGDESLSAGTSESENEVEMEDEQQEN